MTNIGVVYLYRFAEGAAAVHRFLDSYRRHPAGVEHDLHIVLKGFPSEDALASARAIFGSVPFNAIVLNDGGYDIGSYFAAARTVANPQLLFLNTFSQILANNWLAHFDKALAVPGVGLVGATGSWQSGSSGYEAAALKNLRRLKGLYPSVRYPKQQATPTNDADAKAVAAVADDQIDIRRMLRKLPRMSLYPLRLYEFGRHPNPHIRTNAFMIRRDLLLSFRAANFKRKMDAYKFESGRHSMTKQVLACGLRPVVIDRWGKIYEIPEWKLSSTFWIDVQANLLVADNQTSIYAAGSSERRRVLKNHAWDSPWFWAVGSTEP